MDYEPISSAELERLRHDWDAQLVEALARSSASAEELRRDAGIQRRLAALSDIPGQRRALLDVAARYEQAARPRLDAEA